MRDQREDEWESRDREARFDLAMKRIDAEVAENELPAGAEPWPLRDVMTRLRAAADHLLGHHSCDCLGYEDLCAARDAGRRLLEKEEEAETDRRAAKAGFYHGSGGTWAEPTALDMANTAVTSAIWHAERAPSASAWEEVARCERELVNLLPDGGERRIAERGIGEAERKASALRNLDPDASDGIMADGSRVGEQIESDPEKSDVTETLADLIDRDRDEEKAISFKQGAEHGRQMNAIELRGLNEEVRRLAHAAEFHRQEVERLVEELRYSATTWETDHPNVVTPTKRNRRDVIDAEPFLERLVGIFGDPPEEEATP